MTTQNQSAHQFGPWAARFEVTVAHDPPSLPGVFSDRNEDGPPCDSLRELVVNEHGRLSKLDFRITVETAGATAEVTYALGEHRVAALIHYLQTWLAAAKAQPEDAEEEPLPAKRPNRRSRNWEEG